MPAYEPASPRTKQSYFSAAAFFLCKAQRRLTASRIRLRPSGVSRRFFRPLLLPVVLDSIELPPEAPFSNARACCS